MLFAEIALPWLYAAESGEETSKIGGKTL